jgi:hypothetical protein
MLVAWLVLPAYLYGENTTMTAIDGRFYRHDPQTKPPVRSAANTLSYEDDQWLRRVGGGGGGGAAAFAASAPSRQQNHTLTAGSTTTTTMIDAVVLIAIGPAANSPVLGWSAHSVARVGGWDGPIYIVTDRPDDVERLLQLDDQEEDTSPRPYGWTLRPENVYIIPHAVEAPPGLSSYAAKLTKCQLLEILPRQLQNVVYIDSDIIVGRPLAAFWQSIAQMWTADGETPLNRQKAADEETTTDDDVSLHETITTHSTSISLGLFEDGKSYTAGFCKNCDTWNTGVMSIARGHSESCLQAWCDTLRVVGGTDQAALDQVIAAGSQCQNIQALDRMCA